MIRNGADNIAIYVVDLRKRGRIYDAHDIAKRLGCLCLPVDQRDRLEPHERELILHGGISTDEYRIMLYYSAG